MALALSIRQPWLELILLGSKTIEVRSWRTDHRGSLLLHASRTVDLGECERFGLAPAQLQVGAILGVVELEDCMPFTPDAWRELAALHLNRREFVPGLVGWMLRQPRRLEPVPWAGRLGLFTIPESVVGDPRTLLPRVGNESPVRL